jgi:CheY-like chemotaxis protein
MPGVQPSSDEQRDPAARPRAAAGLVLVAEDDPFVRSFAVVCLESLGYKVVAAVDGPDALSQLARGLAPDILFTDIVMPGGLNGWQLAAQAQALRPALKVLYTSGYAIETLPDPSHLDPTTRILNKPYRRADLSRHIQELMAEIGPRG